MEKLLIICEKFDAARNFANALGGETGTFEGDEYRIVSLAGHVLEFAEPYEQAYPNEAETIGKFSKTDTIPWKLNQFDFSRRRVKKAIKNGEDTGFYQTLVNKVSSGLKQGYIPVIASDMDEFGEGDLLVHEVLQYCGYNGKIYREYHESETPKAIRKALSEKKVVTTEDPAYVTGLVRSTTDYMTMQYPRILTARARAMGYSVPVIYAGPHKSNIIRIVGDQEKARREYKPSSEWESRYKLGNLVLTTEDAPRYKTQAEWSPGTLPTLATVRLVKQTPGTTPPPKAFSLTKLASAALKHGVNAERTEAITQKMYSAGVISYPRTGEFTIKPEEFEETLLYVDKVLNLLGLNPAAFSHRTPRKTHVSPDGSHGALRPTENTPFDLTALDAQFGEGASILYRLISERFLMMFLEDSEWVRYDYATVEPDPVFKGSVKVITRQGVQDPDEENDNIVTAADLPDTSQKAELYAHEVKSVAPRKPTEGFVADQLIKFNIGTEATRLRTLISMTKGKSAPLAYNGKLLTLTPYGQVAYVAAKAMHTATPEGFNEIRQLTLLSQKGEPADAIAEKVYEVIKKDIEQLKTAELDMSELELPKVTPQVSGTYVNGETITIFKEFWGEELTQDELDTLFAGGTVTLNRPNMPKGPAVFTGKLEPEEKDGRTFYKLKGTWKADKSATHIKGVWKGQPVEIKRKWGSYEFSDVELQELLDDKTITINYNGRPFHGKLEYQEGTFEGRDVKWLGFKPQQTKRDGYVTGIFNGEEKQVKSEFRGYKFTEKEWEILFDGGNVVIEITNNKGEQQKVSCKLGMNEFTNSKKEKVRYFGIVPTY